jgi:hypothetical protein
VVVVVAVELMLETLKAEAEVVLEALEHQLKQQLLEQ